MIPYSYDTLQNFVAVVNGTAGTSTASSTANSNASTFTLPKLPMKVAIKRIRVRVVTAPASNLTGCKLAFVNGTDTFAIATIATATAGQFVDATAVTYGGGAVLYEGTATFTEITGLARAKELGVNALAEVAADVQPTVNVLSTATASGMAQGVYDIWYVLKTVG
jgi:hypothetical protein